MLYKHLMKGKRITLVNNIFIAIHLTQLIHLSTYLIIYIYIYLLSN